MSQKVLEFRQAIFLNRANKLFRSIMYKENCVSIYSDQLFLAYSSFISFVTRAGSISKKTTCTKSSTNILNILIKIKPSTVHIIFLEQYLEVSEHALCCVVELREQQSLYRPIGVPVVNLTKPKPQTICNFHVSTLQYVCT